MLRRETHVPQEVLEEYLGELRHVFTPEAYNLFSNNCNNFSNELSAFLTGREIPVRSDETVLIAFLYPLTRTVCLRRSTSPSCRQRCCPRPWDRCWRPC
jgi:hypothetical protein